MEPTTQGKSITTDHGTQWFETLTIATRIFKVLDHLHTDGKLKKFLSAVQKEAIVYSELTKMVYGDAHKLTLIQNCDSLIAAGLLDNIGFEDLGGAIITAKQKTQANIAYGKKVQGSTTYGEMYNPTTGEKKSLTKVNIANLFPGKDKKVAVEKAGYKKVRAECPINGRVCPAVEEDAGWICPWSFWHESSGTLKCRLIASVKSISWALRKIATEGLAAPQKKRAAHPLQPHRKIKI